MIIVSKVFRTRVSLADMSIVLTLDDEVCTHCIGLVLAQRLQDWVVLGKLIDTTRSLVTACY